MVARPAGGWHAGRDAGSPAGSSDPSLLAARQMGAERIIAMSRHEDRQKLALEFGATDRVTDWRC